METSHSVDQSAARLTAADIMSSELQSIVDQIDSIKKRSAELLKQISVYEKRQHHVIAALEESAKIVEKINYQCNCRIEVLQANTQATVAPQRAQIAELELEITRMKNELSAPAAKPINPDPESGQLPSGQQPLIKPEIELSASASLPADETRPGTDASHDNIIPRPADTSNKENFIDLDVSLNMFHLHSMGASKPERPNHNRLVKARVEVPEGKLDVVYGQVLAAVTAALLRYDQVVLNEVYPFSLLDPCDDNVAGYFFNLVEDTVAILDLGLVEISLWEDQIRIRQVKTRNKKIDDLLKGEDLVQDLRDSFIFESQDSGNILFNIFKRRN